MPKITFLPQNLVVECLEGTSIFKAGRERGLDIDTACGGKGTCGLCRVKIVQGATGLPEMAFEERRFIGTTPNLRLACRVTPVNDVVVEILPKRAKKNKK